MKTQRIVALCVAALFTGILLLSPSCSKQDASPLSTGDVVQRHELAGYLPGLMGDGPYAKVKLSALSTHYTKFRKDLFDKGVIQWDKRFDCNHFATYYVATAQIDYYLANFHSNTPAQTLALAEVWYHPGGGPGHAIVAACTDAGLVFIEPQTGNLVQLTKDERMSIWLVKW